MNKQDKAFDAVDHKDIKELIYASVKKYDQKVAFVIKHKVDKTNVEYENVTYKRMLEDINKLGTAMYERGYKDKRIAVVGKNRYEWYLAHLSTLLGANVSVPLDKDLQIDELERSLIISKAEAVFFDPKQKEKIVEIKNRGTTNLKDFICMEEDENFENIKALIKSGAKLIKKGKKDYFDAKIDENKMAILLFTSGTSDNPKAVMLSQRNISSTVYAMQRVEDIRETDTNIAFLPFHHIFGSTGMLMMLASGVKNVFPDGLKYIKQNLKEYEVSLFIGVPALVEAMYRTMMREVDKQGKTKTLKIAIKISNTLRKIGIDLRKPLFKSVIDALGGKLRHVVIGGAPADVEVMQAFEDMGIKTVLGYGLTETSPVICSESMVAKCKGSVGYPMCIDEIEIEDPDENGIGQVKVKGPNVMLGYYEMEEKTKEVLKDGWFYTGDLGYFDKHDFLHLTGRSKDMIVLKNGKKIFPDELEVLLNRNELVKECMVFGLPDENDKGDYKLSVKIVYDKDRAKELYPNKDEEGIREVLWNDVKVLNQTFPKYKHIVNMILTDKELIKTTTNKVKRHEEMKLILGENN